MVGRWSADDVRRVSAFRQSLSRHRRRGSRHRRRVSREAAEPLPEKAGARCFFLLETFAEPKGKYAEPKGKIGWFRNNLKSNLPNLLF